MVSLVDSKSSVSTLPVDALHKLFFYAIRITLLCSCCKVEATVVLGLKASTRLRSLFFIFRL